MSTRTDITLRNFFIFNSNYGPKEGEELQKILYYYPITDNVDVQIKNVGLVEGIIQFTGTFKPSAPVNSLHTEKMRQLYFQPEKNYWIVLTLTLEQVITHKDGATSIEYLEDELQDNVYQALLEQTYYMYRLFWGTFEESVQSDDVGTLKTRLENFYKAYLPNLKLVHADILNVFNGIQYLPLDKRTFLKVQCFINSLECTYSDILHTAFLYNDHLIWSGLEPNDMKVIYQYLVGTLLPLNIETELQGGSMPRNFSPFVSLHHGRFITGPENLKGAKTVGKVPKVHLFHSTGKYSFYLVVYRALSASVCLFVRDDKELSLQFFKDLDEYLNQRLSTIASDIAEYCVKQVVTPSNIPEHSSRFIYFNKFNLAYKSTAHLDNKQIGNISCTKEALTIMADLHSKKSRLGHSSESIVKTMNDYWVVAKSSNMREFFIALQQKHASLIEISEEVRKLSEGELKGIFFHPI